MDNKEQQIKILTFYIGNSIYGINIFNVIEILKEKEIENMPNCAEYIEGVFVSRNTVVPVVNLFTIVHQEQNCQERNMFIVSSFNDKTVAFHVGKVNEIISIYQSEIKEPPIFSNSSRGFVKGIVQHKDEIILLLDYSKMIIDVNETLTNNIK